MPTATPNPFDELFGSTIKQLIPTQEQLKTITTPKEPITIQETAPKDVAPKPKYDYTPEKSNRKIVVTVFADKNEGKSYLALSFGNRGNPKDKIFAISFDHKTQPVKDLVFPDLDNVVVHDGTKYYDRSSSKAWLDSSVDSLEYIYSLIQDECGRLKPDWILFDAMETFYTMTEMAMRCNHNLQPYEGIQNRNIWKQRRMFLQHAHDLALRYAEKGIIYTTYSTMKGRIIDADGQLVDAKEVPKWYGVMLLESDAVIRTNVRIVKDELRFFARIEGSKVSLFRTGDERDVTNIGIQAFFEPKIGQPKPQISSASPLPTQILQPIQSQTTPQKSTENLGF